MVITEDEAQNLDTLLNEIIRNKGKSEFDYRDILFKGESDDFIINLVTKLELCGVINTITTKQGRCLSKNNTTASFLWEANFNERYNQALLESREREEIKNLEKQNLHLSIEKNTTDIIDQPKLKKWQGIALIVSIISVIITVLVWKC